MRLAGEEEVLSPPPALLSFGAGEGDLSTDVSGGVVAGEEREREEESLGPSSPCLS